MRGKVRRSGSTPAIALHGGASRRQAEQSLGLHAGRSKGLTLFSGMNKLDFIKIKLVKLHSEGKDGRI